MGGTLKRTDLLQSIFLRPHGEFPDCCFGVLLDRHAHSVAKRVRGLFRMELQPVADVLITQLLRSPTTCEQPVLEPKP